MKYLPLFFIFLTFNALACWKVEGSLGIDGETWKIDQKFDHDKEYSLPMGTFILNISINPAKGKMHLVRYSIFEKKASKLILVTKGKEEIEEEKSEDIFAKGQPKQPNSIITLKLNHI